MSIDQHWLTGDEVTQQKSPNTSGTFGDELPDTIVIHFTGGRSATSSANWLCNPKAKASAHVVIGQEGEIIQLVPFDAIAWHAGRSSWAERTGLNKYSIGIELDNPGRLEQRAEGYYTWFGTRVPDALVTQATHRNETEPTYWHAFTEAQINATEALCQLLMDTYSIQWILGHEEISPSRKVDPGPAFPLDKLRNNLLYQDRHHEDAENFDDVKPSLALSIAEVTADLLNIRSAPRGNASKVMPALPKGTQVKVLEHQADWARVTVETEGWVSSPYIKSTEKS